MFNNKELDFWIDNNLNVLFRGKHGVGKTARIIEAFERNNIKWKYFSAATIDPWVDFVGIPKEKVGPNGESYISFVRPPDIENDEVEAIFFDEFNRAPKKVLNAVMELIQFKSINGKKLNNLKMIWAAVNINENEEDTYSVETIDPAQLDRFQIHVDVPYSLDRQFFTGKYGKDTYDVVKEWWSAIPDKIRDTVSPRRVDYALEIHEKGGNLSYVLPRESNPAGLISRLGAGSFISRLNGAIDGTLTWKDALSDVNFSSWVLENFRSNKNITSNFNNIIPNLNKDLVSKLIAANSADATFMKMATANQTSLDVIQSIVKAGSAPKKVLKNLNNYVPKPAPIAKSTLQTNQSYMEVFNKLNTTYARGNAVTMIANLLASCELTKSIPSLNEIQSMVYTLHVVNKRTRGPKHYKYNEASRKLSNFTVASKEVAAAPNSDEIYNLLREL